MPYDSEWKFKLEMSKADLIFEIKSMIESSNLTIDQISNAINIHNGILRSLTNDAFQQFSIDYIRAVRNLIKEYITDYLKLQ